MTDTKEIEALIERLRDLAGRDWNVILTDQPEWQAATVIRSMLTERSNNVMCLKWFNDQMHFMQARIDALTAERDAILEDMSLANKEMHCWIDEIKKLKAKNNALNVDANRYRWLRSQPHEIYPWNPIAFRAYPTYTFAWADALFGEKLDAEIDSHIENSKETTR